MTWTVARVHEQPSHADVMFFESARIYRLPRAHPRYAAALARLRAAAAAGATVQVTLAAADDEVIDDVA